MAKAVAVCVCPECGKTYERQIDGYNRADADSKKDYAENYPGLCLDCWKKQKEAQLAMENEEYKKKYNLPEIKGVSDKQIAYAVRQRNEFIKLYGGYMDKLPQILQNLNDESYLAGKAQKSGRSPEEVKSRILAKLNSNINYRRAYVVLTKSSARVIIDNLHDEPDAITL